ncbi:MAG TPA: isoprenylcysteine carboxylmethyltransferase family protein [Rubrobacteraceae bacterium]|nr:isoprenylcysteine carboxylmethyltransferase family protein [Rubrobacteraceae bacterium]
MTAITAQYVILACWIIFLLYWLVSWWSIKPTQEKSWSIGRFRRIIIGIVIAFVLLNNLGASIPFFTISLIPRSTPLSVAGVILVITGLGIAIVARRTLAGNWSNVVEVKVDHELITTGIYRYARHPIYTQGSCLWGQALHCPKVRWVYSHSFSLYSVSCGLRQDKKRSCSPNIFQKTILHIKSG